MNALRPRAALRPWRRWVIAGAFGIVWLAFMLAGSDSPPPRGFSVVVAGLAGLVVVVGLSIPSLWRLQGKHGRVRVLGISTVLGAGIGTTLAILFALKGSGEPSIPSPSVAEYAIWIVVVTVVGAVNGTLVGAVTVLCRPRA